MTPSDTGWRMNSDTWLPTAPARVTLTEPPVNTASALRMHANQTYIEAAPTEHSGRTGLVRPHHLNNDLTPSSATDCRERSESLLVSRPLSSKVGRSLLARLSVLKPGGTADN